MPTPTTTTCLATLRSASEDGTRAIARSMAPALVPGDTLLLSGPIGAGKSLFARALIQTRLAAAGRLEDVPSPTYTLVQCYDDGRAEIWHADLFRLETGAEATELGLDEAFETAICLVEWPDRLGASAPPSALHILIEPVGETSRTLRFASADPGRWARLRLAAPEFQLD